jgi:hypothetical protein
MGEDIEKDLERKLCENIDWLNMGQERVHGS